MAGRHRLGVALLVDQPAAAEIDGLRRAVGDRALDRIPPHLTLVPPVNVRGDQLGSALARLRLAAGAAAGPLELTLGPPSTFLPANPVLFLAVGGDLPELRSLRAGVFVPPLARQLTWPWVPHVTLADDAAPARIEAALVALDRYARVVEVDRLVLLEETRTDQGRRWVPLADAALGPPAVVGRGGLALTLVRGRIVDPEAAALLGGAADVGAAGGPSGAGAALADGTSLGRFPLVSSTGPPIVVTARHDEMAVGLAVAWRVDDGGHVAVLVDPTRRRSGIGTHLLAAVESAVRSEGWECPGLVAHGPPGFYGARSDWSRPNRPG